MAFDLWVILHKIDCNGKITNKEDYIKYLNQAYNEKFQSMKEYKCKDNFRHCLDKLKILDVIDAVKRAKFIMQENACNYILQEYKGYRYYTENPSLTVENIVEEVLNECGIIT